MTIINYTKFNILGNLLIKLSNKIVNKIATFQTTKLSKLLRRKYERYISRYDC